ncbi:hypothetical protein GLAREA_10963 [Glarea lozoyensis ATCC 20868]|uniref:Heterokaryon incompatibility domain-containing protein n=1 Tax=Glarea lozoyensis (strain ATCC 20868 / MF5171) TaxID=1116229 RepID=S3DTL1_GLAL2|nr:uncharacterized protein GLAREA_10963 [Glarea lozoyensis ATCC 20868]EPE35266.1 hypothetical protein GLAREA_10963 [Glarea lozoyensis ATCC 20868]
MKLDTSIPFGTTYQSIPQLKAKILEFSQFAIPHHRDPGFLNSLHFLATYRPGETTPPAENEHSNGEHCPCKTASRFSHSDSQTLRLAKTQECTHYLAVSYCWHRGEATRENPDDKFRIRTAEGKERYARAPTDILKRAIEYAIQYDISYIWIDQDCIEQSDRDGKVAGIQSLDLVYRRAVYSVGLLRHTLNSQRHIDALMGIREAQQAFATPDAILPYVDWEAVRELLEHLAGNEWFTRSWILQEHALAKDMRLCVKYGLDLKVPAILQVGLDQVEIIPKDFELATIGHQYVAEAKLDQLSFERLIQAADSINPRPVCQPLGTFEGKEERFGTNASKALWYLRKRKNTRVSDRITIIGNLCDYAIRLDARKMDLDGHSFSIAVLTLALLNGDFSLLFSETDEAVPESSHSWLPVPSSTFDQARSLRDLGDITRFATSGISDRGLSCNGIITQVNHQIDMTNLQKRYKLDYQNNKILKIQTNDEIQQKMDIKIISGIILGFEEQRYHVLASLIRSWAHNMASPDSEPEPPLAYRTADDHFKLKRLHWLINAVMSKGRLWCGNFGGDLSIREPTAIFDCSGPEMVFMPHSESMQNLPPLKLMNLPVAWVVDISKPSSLYNIDSRIGPQTTEDISIKCIRRVYSIFQPFSSGMAEHELEAEKDAVEILKARIGQARKNRERRARYKPRKNRYRKEGVWEEMMDPGQQYLEEEEEKKETGRQEQVVKERKALAKRKEEDLRESWAGHVQQAIADMQIVMREHKKLLSVTFYSLTPEHTSISVFISVVSSISFNPTTNKMST